MRQQLPDGCHHLLLLQLHHPSLLPCVGGPGRPLPVPDCVCPNQLWRHRCPGRSVSRAAWAEGAVGICARSASQAGCAENRCTQFPYTYSAQPLPWHLPACQPHAHPCTHPGLCHHLLLCSTGLLQTCNIQLTDGGDSTQQCVVSFNQAASVCKSGTATDCCAQLGGLGSTCLTQVLSHFAEQGDTESFTAL
jgi:hypothetical protein